MGFSKQGENELEQYGAAVGVAISNGLQSEAIDLAFTRGGGITVREHAKGSTLPARADLDANAVGGADATLTFAQGAHNELSGLNITLAGGQQGAVTVDRSGHQVTGVSVDRDGDGAVETKLAYAYDGKNLKSIDVDEDNDGKVDAVLLPDRDAAGNAPVRGFNVDLGADGSIDGYAELIRDDKHNVTSIRFRDKH